MGGNLFQDCVRLNNDEYNRVIEEITEKFSSIGIRAAVPPCIKNKESHGDIDFIVESAPLSNEELIYLFGPIEIHRNSDTVSILYSGLYQCDFCHHPENFQTAYLYQKWSDLSMSIGRISHSLGFSLGHAGLLFHVRLSDQDNLGKIVVSKDWKEILSFLDLDYDKWNAGFDELIEAFEWLTASKYFNKNMFTFESLNSINRIRNAKRPNFCALVDYCKDREFENNYEVRNKAQEVVRALLHFDNNWFDAAKPLIDARRKKMAVREIFSGVDLLELGYSGKNLGAALKGFQKYFEEKNLQNWSDAVICHTKEEMLSAFKNYETFSQAQIERPAASA